VMKECRRHVKREVEDGRNAEEVSEPFDSDLSNGSCKLQRRGRGVEGRTYSFCRFDNEEQDEGDTDAGRPKVTELDRLPALGSWTSAFQHWSRKRM